MIPHGNTVLQKMQEKVGLRCPQKDGGRELMRPAEIKNGNAGRY
jgi:hypothetical protein